MCAYIHISIIIRFQNFSNNSYTLPTKSHSKKIAVKVLKSPQNPTYQTGTAQEFHVYSTTEQHKALMPPLDHATHIISHQHHCKHHHKHHLPQQPQSLPLYQYQQHYNAPPQQQQQQSQQKSQHSQHQQFHTAAMQLQQQKQQLQQELQQHFHYHDYQQQQNSFYYYDKKTPGSPIGVTTPTNTPAHKTCHSSPQTPKHHLPQKCLAQRQSSTPCCVSNTTPTSQSVSSTPDRMAKTPTSSLTKAKKWRRPFSSYHSCDDLDSTNNAANLNKSKTDQQHHSNEKVVVASLKYLCACTGATLRNLSKKTKDLHKKNCYSYVKVNVKNYVLYRACSVRVCHSLSSYVNYRIIGPLLSEYLPC